MTTAQPIRSNRLEIPPEKIEAVKSRIIKNSRPTPSGCWEWRLSRSPQGYGITTPASKRSMGAHRVSYAAFKGVVPAGFPICHRCDNPPCVNPEHLYLGTQKDNAMDCARKGRTQSPLMKFKVLKDGKLMCRKGLHEISGDNVIQDKGRSPRCRTCKNIYANERNKRRRDPISCVSHGSENK